MVNPKLEQVKSVVIGKTSSWETVPQNSGLWEEDARMELNSPQWNKERTRVIVYNACSMAVPRHEG